MLVIGRLLIASGIVWALWVFGLSTLGEMELYGTFREAWRQNRRPEDSLLRAIRRFYRGIEVALVLWGIGALLIIAHFLTALLS